MAKDEAPSARPRRGRPGYDLASVLAVAVELFNERGYDGTSMRGEAGGQARHREVGDLSPRHRQGGTAQPGPGPGPGRPGGGDGPGAGAARAGHRAPGVPRPGQRRGARSRVTLRHAAAPGARQHRRRAGRARPAAGLRPIRGRTGRRGRARRRHPARRRRDDHRAAAVRPGQLHRRVVQARPAPRGGLAGRPGVRDGLRGPAHQAPRTAGQ